MPHRDCDDPSLRDPARPVLDTDSHTKARMRKKVRGLRKIERAVFQRQEVRVDVTPEPPKAAATAGALVRISICDPLLRRELGLRAEESAE